MSRLNQIALVRLAPERLTDSGEQAWKTYTIPGPGEPGHDTWTGDKWKTGGALTGQYDPAYVRGQLWLGAT